MRNTASLLRVVAVLLVGLILAITNPSHERHQQAIRDVITHDHPVGKHGEPFAISCGIVTCGWRIPQVS